MSKGQPEKSNLDESAVMDSITSQWWAFSAFVPLLTGGLWAWLASRSGLPTLLLGVVPGVLLLGTGLSSLLCGRIQDVPVHGGALAALKGL